MKRISFSPHFQSHNGKITLVSTYGNDTLAFLKCLIKMLLPLEAYGGDETGLIIPVYSVADFEEVFKEINGNITADQLLLKAADRITVRSG